MKILNFEFAAGRERKEVKVENFEFATDYPLQINLQSPYSNGILPLQNPLLINISNGCLCYLQRMSPLHTAYFSCSGCKVTVCLE